MLRAELFLLDVKGLTLEGFRFSQFLFLNEHPREIVERPGDIQMPISQQLLAHNQSHTIGIFSFFQLAFTEEHFRQVVQREGDIRVLGA